MMKFFRRFDPHTHLINRLWFSTLSIILTGLLVLGIICQLFFSSFFLRSSIRRAEDNLSYTANILDDMLEHVSKRFTEICGTKDFLTLFKRIASSNSADFIQLNLDLQDVLRDLASTNTLIDSAVIVNRQGKVYRSLSYGTSQVSCRFTLGYSADEIKGMTLLSRTVHPLSQTKSVYPLAIPLKLENNSGYVGVVDSADDADAILYFLFSADSFSNYLTAYNSDDTEGRLFLLSDAGYFIDPGAGDSTELSHSDDLAEYIADSGVSGHTKNSGEYIFYRRLNWQGLCLINAVEESQLVDSIYVIQTFIITAAVASIIVVSLLTSIAAAYISGPLNQLMRAVRSIENGTYSSDMVLNSLDEMGLLSHAIDSMYHTTQSQFEQIRQERKAKYNTKVRLLTEQINPHFLYNTLEYINMEVYNGHSQNASMMIQNLGEYLRIGLNVGSDMITVSGELDHVRAYVAIMDHRFDHSIAFTSSVEPGLSKYPILKIILQPLVENSIRHGFMLEGNGNSYIAFPTIHIEVAHDSKYLHLTVRDNGIGMDTEKATQIMHTGLDETRAHIGLNNVYQRLLFCYGEDADIIFTSIPYYKNTVEIRIPFDSSKLEGDSN